MNRSLPVITESPETLLNLFRREAKPRLQERFRALCLLSSRQVKTRSALARVPGRHRKTLGHRLSLHEAGRAGRLLEFRTHSNRKPCLGPDALARLKERLASPEGFGCHGEVREWIRDTLGKELKSVTVHSLVRYRLQVRLKVARKSPVKKDEALPARFKKTSPASAVSEFVMSPLP